MKALAVARYLIKKKGSANYFLVRTVSVTKVFCGSVVNAESLPPCMQLVGHEAEQEAAGCPHPHQFILSQATVLPLFFFVTFTISSWSQDRDRAGCCGHVHTWVGAADSKSSKFPTKKHKRFMSPSPEHLAQTGRVGEGEWNRVFTGKLPCPVPLFAVIRLSQPNRAKLLVAQVEHPGESWKELFPRTPQALGPPWLAALLTGAQTWRQQGKPYANMPPEKPCQEKRKWFCAVVFSGAGSHNFVSGLGLGFFFLNTDRYSISWRSFSYLLKQ